MAYVFGTKHDTHNQASALETLRSLLHRLETVMGFGPQAAVNRTGVFTGAHIGQQTQQSPSHGRCAHTDMTNVRCADARARLTAKPRAPAQPRCFEHRCIDVGQFRQMQRRPASSERCVTNSTI